MVVEIIRQIGNYFAPNDLIDRAISYHDAQVGYFRRARMRVNGFKFQAGDKHKMIVSDIRSGASHAWCADRLRAEKGLPPKYDRERISRLLQNHVDLSNNF